VPWALSTGIKPPGHESYRYLSQESRLKMNETLNFALPMCLLGVYRANISFTLTLLEKFDLSDACSRNLIPSSFTYLIICLFIHGFLTRLSLTQII
jgi:hypothetical protein